MALSEDIKNAIEKSLPTMVGKELQGLLARGEKAEADLVEVRNKMKALKDDIQAQAKENSRLQALELDEGKLNARKLTLDEQERGMKLQLVQMESNAATKRADDLFNLVSMVFRNPTIRRTESNNVPVGVPGSPGCTGFVSNYPESRSAEETVV